MTTAASAEETDLRAELREIRGILERMEKAFGETAREAVDLKPYTVGQFAQAVNRCPNWVYAAISDRRIRVLPGGRPYRIPRSEVERWNKLRTN